MLDTRLILIDGLTGAGKSTTAQRLWLHLRRLGTETRWFYEHDTTHPVWWPDEKERIAQAGALAPEFIEEILPARWRNLAATGPATILESSFFQANVGVLLAMNVPDAAIERLMLAVEQAIAPARPALIYFRQPDVARALEEIFQDRRADDYAAKLVAYIGATPYGQAIGLRDVAGLLRFYGHWADLVESVFARLTFSKLAIDRSAGDWPARERQLTDFLGLPPIQDESAQIERPARFVGRYRDAGSDAELIVAADGRGLKLDDARGTRLIPLADGAFVVESMSAVLAFADERGGRYRRLEFHSDLPGLSPVWLRIDPSADSIREATA